MIFYRKTAIYFADRGIGCTLNASPPQNKGWGLLGGMGAFVYMNQDSARENEDDSTEKIMILGRPATWRAVANCNINANFWGSFPLKMQR